MQQLKSNLNKGKLAFLIFFVLVLFLTACTPRQNAADLLNNALEKTVALKSYHFKAKTKMGKGGSAKSIVVEGDWQKPDRLKMIIKTEDIKQEVVIIGGKLFTKAKDQDRWSGGKQAGGQEKQTIQQTIQVLKKFKDAVLLGDEVVAGSTATHIQASYDLTLFTGLTATTNLLGSQAVGDLWVDKRLGYVRQIVVKSTNPKENTPSLELQVTLSRFNRNVSIQPPAL